MQSIKMVIVINIQEFILAVVDKSSNNPDILLTLDSNVFKWDKISCPKGEGRIGLGLIIRMSDPGLFLFLSTHQISGKE